jgi:hypothetical protein
LERQRPGLGRRIGRARDPAPLKAHAGGAAAPRRVACSRSSTIDLVWVRVRD